MKLANNMKKIAVFMVALAAMLIVVGKPTQVYANDFTNPYSLPLDGEWGATQYLEIDESHYYKFEISEAGYFYIKYMSFITRQNKITLYDADYNELGTISTNSGSASSPEVTTTDYVLTQGTYYVRILGSSYRSGDYKLLAGFNSYGIKAVEGDSFDSPQTLTVDKEGVGAITHTNEIDWYKITVPVSGKYRHIYNTAQYTLYNKDLEKLDTFVALDTEKRTRETYLEAGTYYIKVELKKWYAKYSYELETILPEKGEIIELSDGTKYKVTKAGKKNGTVEYYRPASTKKTSVTIPATITYEGFKYNVTGISSNAFENNTKLKKVVIGKNVKTIGTRAFAGCTALTTASFKSGSALTTIKSRAFYNCKKLSSISLPANLVKIDAYAFYKCTGLKKITIPSKVTTIGKQAFYKCSNLKTITIKTTKLTTSKVGEKAFSGIYKKATIKVPKSKLKAYKTLLKKKGVTTSVKFKSF
ncbi:MAG: leucine-rich repeat domain-containing protein [Agathobacter sp.]|nr:leucine-rich repeat domain-containing protein [Agathobacter sp.]